MSLNESVIEDAALEWFEELGYAVGQGPAFTPCEYAGGKLSQAERESYGVVVLAGSLGACGACEVMTNSEVIFMDTGKRKRLEAAGWKVGSTREFLGLTQEEASYLQIKMSLATSLCKLRQKQQLTQTDLARKVKSSQSRIAKMEAGDPSVSVDILIRSLLALGATSKTVLKILPNG